MPIFKFSDLTTTNFPTTDSIIPCVQNGVTKQLSVLQIKQYLDDGTVRELSSGEAVLCNPNPITSTGSVSFYAPGLMSLYAGATDPTGWLICNGRSLVVASYQDLFNNIGYTYGGSGANFNIPNLVGRTAFGLNNIGGQDSQRLSSTYTGGSLSLGSVGGKTEHALTQAETPISQHTHTLNGVFDSPLITGGRDSGNMQNQSTPQESINTTSGSVFVDLTLNPTNPSSNPLNPSNAQVHPNLPPFILLNYIIKT